MEFYTYQYFMNQSQQTNYGKIFIFVFLLVLLLFIILKTFRSQDKMKYRDLIILVSLTITFLLGMQVSEYELGKVNRNNSSQMVNFLDNISESKNTVPQKLAVNSKYLRDEILVKIEKNYYQVNMNTDLSSFQLEETNLMNVNEVKIIKE